MTRQCRQPSFKSCDYFQHENTGILSGKFVHKAYSFIRSQSHIQGASASPQKSRHPKSGFYGAAQTSPFIIQTVNPTALRIGIASHIVLDTIKGANGSTAESIGGPPCYCGVTSRRFGFDVSLATRVGKDFPQEMY